LSWLAGAISACKNANVKLALARKLYEDAIADGLPLYEDATFELASSIWITDYEEFLVSVANLCYCTAYRNLEQIGHNRT
jgi:hypothetical protein